jgi:hypothetical protein
MMASLLIPDDEQQWPTSAAGLLPVDDRGPLASDPRADVLGDALGETYRAISDEMARQQQISADRGLWSGGGLLEGGHPTRTGVLNAIGQTGTAVALGTGGAPERPGFTAYHGSPHLFPPTEANPLGAFDPAKVGTGEGAQAYGVGAGYLAEAEGVARGYRDALAPQTISREGVPFAEKDLDRAFARKVEEATGNARLADTISVNVSQALKTGRLGDLQASLEQATNLNPEIRQGWKAALDHAAEFNVERAPGHMYEVQVAADPERFLHWNKPLSEQHPDVQAGLAKLEPDFYHPSSGNYDPMDPGYMAYNRLGHSRNPAAVSQALKDAGIPGIRYLADQGTGGPSGTTHNVVVFSPEIMEIIRRYGIGALMAGGGAAAMRGQQQEQ